MTNNAARFEAALGTALEAFWIEFAKAYPEATSGDLSPPSEIAIEQAARAAGADWLSLNAPNA